MKIFLAGATGAIGKRLVPLLIEAKHHVVGTTRSEGKGEALRAAGAEPVVVDVFDGPALLRAITAARPDAVVHLLTDLPYGLDPRQMAEGTRRNARMRKEGTHNLVSAALRSGARQLVAASIAWMYAPGGEPHVESDPLDVHAAGDRAITVEGVAVLERLVLATSTMSGTVLRYGHLYGPGTGVDSTPDAPSLHVDAAAFAAVRAIESAQGGVYNIADQSGYLSIAKAQRVLGFQPGFRRDGPA